MSKKLGLFVGVGVSLLLFFYLVIVSPILVYNSAFISLRNRYEELTVSLMRNGYISERVLLWLDPRELVIKNKLEEKNSYVYRMTGKYLRVQVDGDVPYLVYEDRKGTQYKVRLVFTRQAEFPGSFITNVIFMDKKTGLSETRGNVIDPSQLENSFIGENKIDIVNVYFISKYNMDEVLEMENLYLYEEYYADAVESPYIVGIN